MPAKSGENKSLKSKLGSKLAKAVASHKDDETVMPGGGNLPAGIENGIARLVDCRIGWYKEGDKKDEPFFIAAGIVVAPNSIRDDSGATIPIVGLRTQIGPEPICDTPKSQGRKTVDDHLGWVLNQMRLLGCDTSDLDEDSLESAMDALKEAAPYFRFRTWISKPTPQFPNPRVNHQWQGASGLENYSPDADDGAVEDSTSEDESEAPPAPKAKPVPAKPVAKRQPVPKPEPEAEEDAEAEAADDAVEAPQVDEDEVRALSEKADRNDKKSQQRLTKMAEELGIDSDAVENAENWIAVADLIINAGAGGESSSDDDAEAEGESEPEEAWRPQKEEVYKYLPIDPKTKKPSKKSVEVEVLAVDAKAETVTVKSLDDGKTTWKAVPWAKLLQD